MYLQPRSRETPGTACNHDDFVQEGNWVNLTFGVTPVADEPQMSPLTNTRSPEDERISLSNSVNFASSNDRDGSERHWLIIVESSLPVEGKLFLNDVEMTAVDGLFEIEMSDISNLFLQPTPESNEPFTLTLRGKTIDTKEVIDCSTGLLQIMSDTITTSDFFLPSKYSNLNSLRCV